MPQVENRTQSTFGLVTVGARHVCTKVNHLHDIIFICMHVSLIFISTRLESYRLPDPYENCYAVVRGTKKFVLLPPIEYYCVHGKTCHNCDSREHISLTRFGQNQVFHVRPTLCVIMVSFNWRPWIQQWKHRALPLTQPTPIWNDTRDFGMRNQ